MRAFVLSMVAGVILCLTSGTAFGQSGVAGVVKDTTGAVVPGVTVEASSPALIEKVRTGVTDADGQYKLVDLRPGTYTVTFALQGFSTVKVEGINLPSGFTATVNAEMRVGAVEEAITVTGAAPAVDVKSSTQSTELSKALLDALPLGRSPHNFAQAIPAVTGVNLGGFATGRDANRLQVYGSSVMEATVAIDGDRISYGTLVGGPGVTTRPNPAMVGEISAVTTGGTAQYALSGVQMNLIPKEGGNSFSGYMYWMWADDGWQASNVTADLRAQRVTRSGLVKQWDVDPAFGGPLKRDKLWFYASVRNAKIVQYRPGLYDNLTPGAWTYTSDPSRPSTAEISDPDYSVRLTWQATAKDKINFFASTQPRTMNRGFELNTVSHEATDVQTYPPNRVLQLAWKRPVTSRVLLDAGWTRYDITLFNAPQPGTSAVDPEMIAVIEQTTGLQYRSPTMGFPHNGGGMWTYRGSASYVTGSHYFKAGLTLIQQTFTSDGFAGSPHRNITYRLNRGVPNLMTLYAPVIYHAHIKADSGLYAQDQWTVNRLTLNLGLRYDYFNGWNESEAEPGSRFVGPRTFGGSRGTPTWHDVNPRIGAAFDLFGDSRTALKFSIGRYVIGAAADAVVQANPAASSVQTATRTWTDSNRDYIPDCDLANPSVNGECGRLSNLNFGGTDPTAATVDPAVLRGFGVRPYQWEMTLGLQRQLATGWSATLSYVRRSYGNFTVTRNTAVPQNAYDPYCVTAPVDARLPGGGGNQICGLYDIKPEYFQLSKNVVTFADQFGRKTQIYNGFDLSTTANLPNAAQLLGGITVGRTALNQCFIVNSPQELRFCDVKQPFQPIFKMTAHVPVAWGLDATVMYQTLPGGQSSISSSVYNVVNGIQANYTVLNSQVVPSLGRNLAAGAAATVTIPLIPPDTMYTPRQHIVNARFTRAFRRQRLRVVPGIEIDNLLNASTAFSVNNTYGPSWLTVDQIMNPRNVQVNAQITF